MTQSTFCDVLDVPLTAGLAALDRQARLRRPVAPAAVHGDRLLVLLPDGAAEDVPELLRWLGWSHLEAAMTTRQLTDPQFPGADAPQARPEDRAGLCTLLDGIAHACAAQTWTAQACAFS